MTTMPFSTANWHWKNKNVTPWAKAWFERELVAVARDFAREELRPAADEMQRAVTEHGIGAWALPEGLLAKASQAGLLTYGLPEAYGGGGLDLFTSALIFEELCWGDAGIASLFGGGMQSSLAGSSVVEKNLDRLTIFVAAVWVIAIVGTGLLIKIDG